MEALLVIGIKRVEVLGDLKLVISHVNKEWEVREEKFKPYLDYIENLKKYFDELVFVHITRKNNQVTDALATLAYVWDNIKGLLLRPMILTKARLPCFENTQVLVMEEEKKPWYSDILRLMEYDEFPENASKKDRMLLRSFAKRFFNGVLYKKDKAMHLIYVLEKEAE